MLGNVIFGCQRREKDLIGMLEMAGVAGNLVNVIKCPASNDSPNVLSTA